MAAFYWMAIIFGACALACWLEELNDRRSARRRIQRLRERRRYLDEMEPRRWTT